ncbi:hypothetical protein JWG40_08360 [Leptospira sp. 201903074]|uniref:LA_3751/LA_3752 family putative glycosyltransferase n=1 Tax=Leptospira abararensis TaxID=2810036 RepID=UPI0019631DD7|nr:hypothetical protein [Leptospira abararensis]MBM9547027.1 hypothetical protein [Leptospira abararensis]
MKHQNRKSNIGKLTLFFLSFIAIIYSIEYTQPQFSLFQDSHDKAVQTFSLWENRFQTDNLYYPAKNFDPKLEFFHLPTNLHVIHDGKLLSAFPVQFALLMAPLLSLIPLHFLPYTSIFFLFLGLWILRKFYGFSMFLLWVSYFTTFLWPLSWEYSELPAVFALTTFGLLPFLRENRVKLMEALSGISLGWVMIVRLETIVFFGIFFIFHFYYFSKSKRQFALVSYLKTYKLFLTAFILFIVTNLYLNYVTSGHILGTRFLANSNGFSAGFEQRLQWLKSLLFFSDQKIGFFGYIPLALLLFTVYWIRFNKISNRKKALLFASSGMLIIIPWIAPNDGFNNWGPRFYTIVITAYLILLKPYFSYFYHKKKKFFFLFLFTFGIFSFSLGVIGAKIQKSKTNLSKKSATILAEIQPDILVYQDYLNLYTCGTFYFNHTVVIANNMDSITRLLENASHTNTHKSIAFITWNPILISKELKEAINENKRKSGYPLADWDEALLESNMKKYVTEFQILDKQNYRIWTGKFK